MGVGTKSLLFGVHQFLWHPITVCFAWVKLYGRPSWQEALCIFIHDWGYWGQPNIDGPEGERHPELAARITRKYLSEEYQKLCLYHSRHYANMAGDKPSKLCWADKLSIIYEPWWWYLFRARLSGELKEYRERAAASGEVPWATSDKEWFEWLRDYLECVAIKEVNNSETWQPLEAAY